MCNMLTLKRHITIIIFCFVCINARSQILMPNYESIVGGIVSGGRTAPFWFISNSDGKFSKKNNCGFFETDVFSLPDTSKMLTLDYGAGFFIRYDSVLVPMLNEAWAGLNVGFVSLRVGKREEFIGNNDSTLTGGSLLWSHNARAMPKITLLTPEYTDVPFTRGYLQFKALLSHGWFEPTEFSRNVLLHHKYVYLQAGGDLPVNIHFGYNHYAMWGGSVYRNDTLFADLPVSVKDFWNVFLPKGGDEGEVPEGESVNKVGNHIGSRNYGGEIKFNKFNFMGYFQTVFEDNSGKRWHNKTDGFYGVVIKVKKERPLISKVLYEYMNTTNQSGTAHNDTSGKIIGGNDNYFNHSLYRNGWTYYGMTIGTPFITSPVFNGGQELYYKILNNKVVVHHVGVEGTIKKHISYRMLFSYSINQGINSKPFTENKTQSSCLIEVNIPLSEEDKGLNLSVATAADIGEMYGNNFGVMLSLIKTGSLQEIIK